MFTLTHICLRGLPPTSGYSADYGYFDRFSNSESSTGQLVTFISPCPAKGPRAVCVAAKIGDGTNVVIVPGGNTKGMEVV